jgi:Spy/CpxP family protein refolding chaperone
MLFVNLLASFDDVAGDEGGEGAAKTVITNPGGEGAAGGDAGDRKFSQDDVNRFVQDRLSKDRKKHEKEVQEQVSSLEAKYEDLLTNKNLDSVEKEKLEGQLDDLRKQHRTKEQQLAHEKKTIEEEWQGKYETAISKGNEWENRYTESTITQALQSAAISNDAYNPQQIIVQLRSQTKLVEKMDAAGKPTGNLVPMVEMTVKNEDNGAQEQLQMTPDEAVEYMKKSPGDWGNFFKNNIREGIGSSSATGGALTGDGNVDHTKLTDEQWFKMRKDNPGALGMDYKR